MAHVVRSFPPVAATPTWQPPTHSAWFANGFDNVLLQPSKHGLGATGQVTHGDSVGSVIGPVLPGICK